MEHALSLEANSSSSSHSLLSNIKYGTQIKDHINHLHSIMINTQSWYMQMTRPTDIHLSFSGHDYYCK